MKNRFLQISLGVALILFSTGFFIRSITRANATPPSPAEFIDQGTNTIGKYQMQLTNAYNGDASVVKILVYDTETGESKLYTSLSLGAFAPSIVQIPQNPLGK